VALILVHFGYIIRSFLGETYHSLSCEQVSNNDVMLTFQLQEIIITRDLNSKQTQTYEAPSTGDPEVPKYLNFKHDLI
jgi:hypothetical protein